jgi:hypothetical protein
MLDRNEDRNLLAAQAEYAWALRVANILHEFEELWIATNIDRRKF